MEESSMKRFLFAAAFAATLLLSCRKENNTQEELILPQSDYPVLKAQIVSTKTTIDGLAVSFEEGDQIAVFNGVKDSDTHLPTRYSCSAVSGGTAYFVYAPSASDDSEIVPDPDLATVVATYPYRSPSTGAFEEYGSGTLKIRMTATGSTSSTSVGFIMTSLPLVASAAKDATLSFKQTAGLLRVNMKGTATLSGVSMTSNQNISGDASVYYTVAEPVLSLVGTGKNITYTYSNGIVLNESDGVELYFGLPAGTHNVTFVFTDSEGKTMTRLASGLEIKRGYITPSSLTYTPDVIPTTNLSEGSKYANCYVVKAAGNYCFDARKPDGTLVSGSSATWVWASGEAFASTKTEAQFKTKMMGNISLSGGKIYFNVPSDFTVGNVVLGIVDGSSNLLYTWHIWLTSDDINDVAVTSGSNTVTVMDRDLGAGGKVDVSATENGPWQRSRGTYYQWGRKDPILGSRNNTIEKASPGTSDKEAFNQGNSQYHIENTSLTNVTTWGYGIDFGGLSADDGAKYPVSMAKIGCVPGHIADDFSTLWSERTNANPCPYGYRVMNKDEMDWILALGAPSVSYYNSFHAINAGGLLFPGAGMRYGSDGTFRNNADVKYYLDNQISTTNAKAKAYRFQWDSKTHAYSTGSYSEFDTYHAGSVRCVKQ